jgi:16S rRNA (cytidine1402-2'-O)-methyltransferase
MIKKHNPGRLYLIPSPLGSTAAGIGYLGCLPAEVRQLAHFVVENARSARRVLGGLGLTRPLQSLDIQELNEHTPAHRLDGLLVPLLAGEDVGLLSEAGCPAIADPGAQLVRRAHANGVRVLPLIGPSAILLALMASGLDGQRFAFCGYLPRRSAQREIAIRQAEERSRRLSQTQIFIETPYRNDALLAALLGTCAETTLLCIAADLTRQSEQIVMRSIAQWRASQPLTLDHRPTTFLLLAAGQSANRVGQGSTQQRLAKRRPETAG